MDLQELLAKRARAWEASKEIMERAKGEGREFTAEERQSFDRSTAEVEQLTGDIRRAEEHIKRAAEFDKLQEPLRQDATRSDERTEEDEYREAYLTFLRSGMEGLDSEQRQSFSGKAATITPEMRAAGVGTGSAGGYLVPPAMRDRIIEAEGLFGNVQAVAETIDTTTGVDLPWPTADDTANVGAILGENTQATEQDVTLGTDLIKAYMYHSKVVRASYQILQDAGFDFETWLTNKLAERIGRIRNQHYTTGTGTSQPQGVVTGAAIGKTGATGKTTSFDYKDLVDTMLSVKAGYRRNGRWMFGDGVLAGLFSLTDTNGNPIWLPSIREGAPDLLLGKPIEANDDMPAPAANAKSILFGDFKRFYVVRTVKEYQLLRLTERYADYLQVGFLGFSRSDGKVQDAAAVKAYRHSAT